MAVFEFQNVSFTYPGVQKPALSELTFSVQPGEFLLLCGPSGCGKSTLLRLMKHLIAPAGEQNGQILYKGEALKTVPQGRLASEIGFVLQNPDHQLVADKVRFELAFGLEQRGEASQAIAARIAEIAAFFGMESQLDQATTQLSGGQKQLLNMASVLVMEPDVLLLDEPLSQLDPVSRLDLLAQLQRLNQDMGITVILCDHQMDDLFALCDHVLVMEEGRGLFYGEPKQAARYLVHTDGVMKAALPASVLVGQTVDKAAFPLDVKQARKQLEQADCRFILPMEEGSHKGTEAPVVRCKNVVFGYEKGKSVLSGLNFTAPAGACTALIGGNGAGKTTLLHLLAGNRKPQGGKVQVFAPSTCYLPQNPYHSFIKDTVEADLLLMQKQAGLEETVFDRIYEQYPFFHGIRELYAHNPMDLSGGEAQKLALLKIVAIDARLILLDEPTKGLDAPSKEQLLTCLQTLKAKGSSMILVSHDLDFIARFAERCVLLFEGRCTVQATPRTFFCANSFYTTPVRKIVRGFVEGAVTIKDLEEMAR